MPDAPTPAALPPGITAQDLARHRQRETAFAVAAADPLPGPARAAFAGAPREVCGFTLHPVVASHVVLLQQIESPLLAAARVLAELVHEPEAVRNEAIAKRVGQRRRGETAGEHEARLAVETVETFYLFTQPPPQIRALLAQGRVKFREQALAAVLDRVPLTALGEIQRAVGEHFASGFITAIQYEAEKSGDGSFPSAPAAPGTGSAGA